MSILNEKDIRESFYFRCENCGKEVFGEFNNSNRVKLCDSCKIILNAEKQKNSNK